MIHKTRAGPCRALAAALAAAAVLLFLMVYLLFHWARPAGGPEILCRPDSAGAGNGRVILLLADRLTYGDLRSAAGPHLSRLLAQGAVALMNVRTGRAGSESGYLSLGAAARAVAGPEGKIAFGGGELYEGERAETIFERRAGEAPAGAVFHLQTAALKEKNRDLPYRVTVGLLGEMLGERGLTAAVWGNADGAAPNRSAVMVAMDSRGVVSIGETGAGMLQEDILHPYGLRTDTDRIAALLEENFTAAHLHVIEFGDTSRLDDYWPNLSPARGAELFGAALQGLDRLLEKLQPLVDQGNCSLFLAVPSLPQNRPAGREQLAPLLIAGYGISGPGLLYSSATRRPGLVQNTDLASMILFLLAGPEMGGSPGPLPPFGIATDDQPLEFLDHFSMQAARVFSQRSPLLKGYVALLVGALLIALAGLLLKVRFLFLPTSLVIRMLLFVPPALLLLPGLIEFPRPAAWQSAFILSGAALLPALLLHPLQNRNRHLYWAVLGWGIAFALIIDTLSGAPLQQLSLFSYDPVGGARYYGMGNEYMGVLIGATLLGTVSLKAFIAGEAEGPDPKIVVALAAAEMALLYGLIVFVLAAPNFGANLGGTLSAAVAFGAAWAEFSGMGVQRGRPVLSVAAFLVLAAAFLWMLNGCLPQLRPSHVGLFGEMVRSHGPAAFWETAWRKMSMNLKLVRYSIWGRALVTLVGLCLVFSLYPGGLRRRLRIERPALVAAVIAALAGAAAALLTNDSGVVAAATILLYTVPPALITIMQKSYAPGQDITGGGQD